MNKLEDSQAGTGGLIYNPNKKEIWKLWEVRKRMDK